MNKSESKYFNTAKRMDEAFLELLEKKDISFITVKEICERAQVNRSTFYLHYETIGDLLSESVELMTSHFHEYMRKNSSSSQGFSIHSEDEPYFITPRYLTPYLEYIREHRRLFKTVTSNSKALRLDETYEKMFCNVFAPILTRYGVPESDHRYIMSFYISGIMAIIAEWLKDDCKAEVEHIIKVIRVCIMTPESTLKKEKGKEV